MELMELTERVSVILARTNVGVINKKFLIDTGINKEVGRQIRKLLDSYNTSVERIYNTHGHIDHVGGNIYFYRKGCKIYMPKKEEIFLKYPKITGMLLDYPELKPIQPIEEINTELDLLYIPLPGHSVNQVGYLIDNVFFCGDVIVSESIIEKHKIVFHTHISAQKETLKNLSTIDAKYWVPSHSEEILRNPKPLIKKNLNNIIQSEKLILDLCEGKTTEEILKEIIEYLQIQINQKIDYFVFKKLISNYLTSLFKEQRVKYEYQGGMVIWKRI